MLLKQGIPVTIGNIRLVDVAKNIGRTTGASYNIWPAQEDFHRELAIELAEQADWLETGYSGADTDAMILAGAGLPDVIRVFANQYLEAVASGREFLTFIHFWSVALDDPPVRAAIRKGYDGFQEKLKCSYETLLAHYGLEMTPPFTVDDLTVSMAAVTEGFLLRYSVDPDRVRTDLRREDRPDAPDGWSLYGCALERTITAMTRPITSLAH